MGRSDIPGLWDDIGNDSRFWLAACVAGQDSSASVCPSSIAVVGGGTVWPWWIESIRPVHRVNLNVVYDPRIGSVSVCIHGTECSITADSALHRHRTASVPFGADVRGRTQRGIVA